MLAYVNTIMNRKGRKDMQGRTARQGASLQADRLARVPPAAAQRRHCCSAAPAASYCDGRIRHHRGHSRGRHCRGQQRTDFETHSQAFRWVRQSFMYTKPYILLGKARGTE